MMERQIPTTAQKLLYEPHWEMNGDLLSTAIESAYTRNGDEPFSYSIKRGLSEGHLKDVKTLDQLRHHVQTMALYVGKNETKKGVLEARQMVLDWLDNGVIAYIDPLHPELSDPKPLDAHLPYYEWKKGSEHRHGKMDVVMARDGFDHTLQALAALPPARNMKELEDRFSDDGVKFAGGAVSMLYNDALKAACDKFVQDRKRIQEAISNGEIVLRNAPKQAVTQTIRTQSKKKPVVKKHTAPKLG